MLGIELKHYPDRTEVIVRGEVDLTVLPQLRAALITAVHEGSGRIEVDLGDVPFLDSAGLGVLIGGLKRARTHQRDLVLVHPSAPVHRVLELTNLDAVFGCRVPSNPVEAAN